MFTGVKWYPRKARIARRSSKLKHQTFYACLERYSLKLWIWNNILQWMNTCFRSVIFSYIFTSIFSGRSGPWRTYRGTWCKRGNGMVLYYLEFILTFVVLLTKNTKHFILQKKSYKERNNISNFTFPICHFFMLWY